MKIKRFGVFLVLVFGMLSASVQALEFKVVEHKIKPANQTDLLGFWRFRGHYYEFTKDNQYIFHDTGTYDLKKIRQYLKYKVTKDNFFELTGTLGDQVYNKTPFLFFIEDKQLKIAELPSPRRSTQGPLKTFYKLSSKDVAAYHQSIKTRKAKKAELEKKGQYDLHPADRDLLTQHVARYLIDQRLCKTYPKVQFQFATKKADERAYRAYANADCKTGQTISVSCSAYPLRPQFSCHILQEPVTNVAQ